MNALAVPMNNEIGRTPAIVAAEINSIKRQTRVIMLQASIEIGQRLVEAKTLVPHGEWAAWLENNVDYSQRTANNLMRIADEYGVSSNSQALANLNYTQAVALLGMPVEEREEFVEQHDVESISTRELQQLMRDRSQLTEQLEAMRIEKEALDLRASLARDDLENERQRAKERETTLLAELDKERALGKQDEAEQQKLERELEETQRKLQDLQEQAAQPMTLEPAVVEKVPEEVTNELNRWRERAQKLEARSEAVTKYRVQFEALVTGFRNLLGALEEVKVSDPDAHTQYRDALLTLIERMRERL